MTEYSYDGHPIQAGAGHADYQLTGRRAHYSIMDMREMVVVARFFTDDPDNRSKRFIEYTCRDLHTSELYPGCRQLSQMSGVEDGDDNVLRPASSLLPGATGVTGALVGEQTPASDVDGDQVLVGFISGSRSRPVIIGVFRHSASQYGATAADGERRLTRHKGTSVVIGKDGTWLVSNAKSSIEMTPDGEVTITAGADQSGKSGSTIVMTADGDVFITCNGIISMSRGDQDTDEDAGVVNGQAVDPFTGATQFALGNASGIVRAHK